MSNTCCSIHVNGKIYSTTFDQMHSAKSKIWQSRILANRLYKKGFFLIGLSFITKFYQWGEISCPATGVSMVPTNVLKLLLCEKLSVKNTTTTKAREKNKHRFGILKILEIFDVHLIKFENNQILLNKSSHRFLPTTKLFTWQKSLIFHD